MHHAKNSERKQSRNHLYHFIKDHVKKYTKNSEIVDIF